MNVIKYAPNGTIWIVEGGEPAFEFKFPDKSTMKNNLLPVAQFQGNIVIIYYD